MDAKEAAKIVYDAVWADTSDPNRTYLNAATALLSELRKHAGIGLLLGANQPLALARGRAGGEVSLAVLAQDLR